MKLIYAIRSQGHGTLGRGVHSDWKGARAGVFNAGNVLFLDLGGGHTVVEFVKISIYDLYTFLKFNVSLKLQYSIKIINDPLVKVKNNKGAGIFSSILIFKPVSAK